jgi:hypothetical protein
MAKSSYDWWVESQAEYCLCENCNHKDHFEKMVELNDGRIVCFNCEEQIKILEDAIEELL